MTTRQYARLLSDWLVGIELDPQVYGRHSLRRTKTTARCDISASISTMPHDITAGRYL